MQINALRGITQDIYGSIRSASQAQGAETIADLIIACQVQVAIERAVASGDRLLVRQTLRPAFSVLGWRWDTNALWMTS